MTAHFEVRTFEVRTFDVRTFEVRTLFQLHYCISKSLKRKKIFFYGTMGSLKSDYFSFNKLYFLTSFQGKKLKEKSFVFLTRSKETRFFPLTLLPSHQFAYSNFAQFLSKNCWHVAKKKHMANAHFHCCNEYCQSTTYSWFFWCLRLASRKWYAKFLLVHAECSQY